MAHFSFCHPHWALGTMWGDTAKKMCNTCATPELKHVEIPVSMLKLCDTANHLMDACDKWRLGEGEEDDPDPVGAWKRLLVFLETDFGHVSYGLCHLWWQHISCWKMRNAAASASASASASGVRGVSLGVYEVMEQTSVRAMDTLGGCMVQVPTQFPEVERSVLVMARLSQVTFQCIVKEQEVWACKLPRAGLMEVVSQMGHTPEFQEAFSDMGQACLLALVSNVAGFMRAEGLPTCFQTQRGFCGLVAATAVLQERACRSRAVIGVAGFTSEQRRWLRESGMRVQSTEWASAVFPAFVVEVEQGWDEHTNQVHGFGLCAQEEAVVVRGCVGARWLVANGRLGVAMDTTAARVVTAWLRLATTCTSAGAAEAAAELVFAVVDCYVRHPWDFIKQVHMRTEVVTGPLRMYLTSSVVQHMCFLDGSGWRALVARTVPRASVCAQEKHRHNMLQWDMCLAGMIADNIPVEYVDPGMVCRVIMDLQGLLQQPLSDVDGNREAWDAHKKASWSVSHDARNFLGNPWRALNLVRAFMTRLNLRGGSWVAETRLRGGQQAVDAALEECARLLGQALLWVCQGTTVPRGGAGSYFPTDLTDWCSSVRMVVKWWLENQDVLPVHHLAPLARWVLARLQTRCATPFSPTLAGALVCLPLEFGLPAQTVLCLVQQPGKRQTWVVNDHDLRTLRELNQAQCNRWSVLRAVWIAGVHRGGEMRKGGVGSQRPMKRPVKRQASEKARK